jgi:nitrogen-specific signal transduction histidine kinase
MFKEYICKLQNHLLPGGLNKAKIKYFIIALALIVLSISLYGISRNNYPLFHSMVDMATVFIAGSVFIVVWNRRNLLDNHFYLFLGIGFLFFAFLNFMHLLGNKDMGVFPQFKNINIGPTLYIASRYVLSISFLLAPLFIKRKFNISLTMAVYLLITVLLMLSIFYWQNFPATYIEGVGLTRFKVISDYIICLILLGAIGLLLANRRSFDAKVLKIMVYSIILSIATGLAFTLYTDPFGVTNAIGHFFQIASFYLVYIAVIATVLTRPQDILYRNLQQSQEALKESEEKYRNLFTSMIEEVYFWKLVRNEKGEIKTWSLVDANPPALKTWGRHSIEEIRGKTSDEIFGPSSIERYMPMVQKIMTEGTPYSFEDYFPDPGKYFRFTSMPLGEHFIMIGADITQIKKAEQALQRYTSELETANKELEAFSYSVSHDLKAPLRTMDGFSEAVLMDYKDKLDDTGRDYLNRVRKASQTMSQLIDDILKLSRINRAELYRESINLSNMVKLMLNKLRDAQPERQARFIIAPELNIYGDRNLLKIALGNLLENAWKYTGKVSHTRIEFGMLNQKTEKVYFIKDNGIGFDMKSVDRLFQPFQRLHSSKEYPGTGIGLATVQRVISRHHGRIWAESEVGKGSTFYFTLE